MLKKLKATLINGLTAFSAVLGYPMFTLPWVTNALLLYGIPGIATGYGSIKLAQAGATQIRAVEEGELLAVETR